jgi:subtilisin family serine protease
MRLGRRTLAAGFIVGILVPVAMAAGPKRYIVIPKSAAQHNAARNDLKVLGGRIKVDLPQISLLAVSSDNENFPVVALASPNVQAVVPDTIKYLIRPQMKQDMFGVNPGKYGMPSFIFNPHPPIVPDPALSLPGLMWNLFRIRAQEYWEDGFAGDPAVKVAVADTGIDYTHPEMTGRVAQVVDLTVNEDPPICKTYFTVPSPPYPNEHMGDADWATFYGGPATTDWNGHGSWIGGNIAAALDHSGINGIAPKVKLVALKISQWCGAAYDSTIMAAFTYAADNNLDIVSISFGGYLNRNDPDQEAIYQAYTNVVNYALRKGTLIVASAGNEHVRLGLGGKVVSHGQLTAPGGTFSDLFGLWENPGGVPGVVAVAATGNIVKAASASCPAGTTGSNATCKPSSDTHQPIAAGLFDQLAYYSNYGPRIDFAAPGGARKFNLPLWDRGGTPGFPVTNADGFNAFQTFSITSDWALEIPCYFFSPNPYFPAGHCYSTIQGTSMATPHVSAALALVASKYPILRHRPLLLVVYLSLQTVWPHNYTPPLSATDTSAGDLETYPLPCTSGYCHLGGPPIPSSEAYGIGLVHLRF